MPALAADLAVLVHKMAFCSWGIGYILDVPVEPQEDLAVILGLWSKQFGTDALRVSAAGAGTGWVVYGVTHPTYGAAVLSKALGKAAHTPVPGVPGRAPTAGTAPRDGVRVPDGAVDGCALDGGRKTGADARMQGLRCPDGAFMDPTARIPS